MNLHTLRIPRHWTMTTLSSQNHLHILSLLREFGYQFFIFVWAKRIIENNGQILPLSQTWTSVPMQECASTDSAPTPTVVTCVNVPRVTVLTSTRVEMSMNAMITRALLAVVPALTWREASDAIAHLVWFLTASSVGVSEIPCFLLGYC